MYLATEIKGLILSGGSGTRLCTITHTYASSSCRWQNKLVFYGIEALVQSAFYIIARTVSDEVREVVGDPISGAGHLMSRAGLAHAVLTAEEFRRPPFIINLR